MSRVSLLVSTGIAVSPELQSEQLCRNSHRPTRRREWRMLRFKSPAQARRLLSAHPMIYGHFRPCRQPMSADCCRRACAEAFRDLLGGDARPDRGVSPHAYSRTAKLSRAPAKSAMPGR